MAGSYVEELVAFLGWEVDSKELTKFNEQAKDVTDTIKGVAVAVTAAAVGLTAFVTMTNKATAVQTGLAQANNVSAQMAEDLGRMMSGVGLSITSVTKSVIFLNKTMGGIKSGAVSATAVDKALAGVGLRLKEIQKLDAEEQFIQIMEAAKNAEDAQVGNAAVTATLGREAGRMVGYFRARNKSVRELLAIQNQMNLQTEEGRMGALRFFSAMDLLEAASDSTREALAGLAGEGLAPLLEGVVEWIGLNKELLQQKIKIWADRLTIALKWLWQGMHWLWLKTNQLVDTFGGFENMAKLIGIAMAAMFSAKVMMLFASFINMVKAATLATTLMNAAIGLTPAAIAAVIALLFLLGEDLYHFFTGGESLLGDLGEKIAEFASMNIRPFIASLLGMTPEELDLAMVRVVNSVTDFFTKSIPEAYAWLVEKVEQGIGFIIESVLPVAKEVFVIFKDMWGNMIDYLWAVGEKVVDAIVWPFKKGFELAKGILSSIPGGDALGSLLPGSGAGASTAGVGASNSARAAAASVVNNRNASSSVNQATTINVTQLPGESGEGLARRIKETIGGELRRAVVATQSGVE